MSKLAMNNTRARQAMTALSARTWFPQAPLALGVGLLGLVHLILVLDQAEALHLHLSTPGSAVEDLTGVSLLGISQLSVGVFLLVIAIGLWLRSSLAWLLSLLVATLGAVTQAMQSGLTFDSWLFAYAVVMMGLLLASRRTFDRRNMRLGTLTALAALLVLLGYAVFGSYHLGTQFSPAIDSLADAFYVSVVTISTVGFGDYTPATPEARLFMASVIIFSLAVLSSAVGATLIPAMIHGIEQINLGKRNKMNRKNHYVIVGYSALAANTYRELRARNEHVTIIVRHPPDGALFPGSDVDMVVGDGSDLGSLREAGADQARAILALLDDDSENAFVILAAKELNVSAKKVAAVNELKHLSRVRRVHPDMIIAPQILGGELLTNMLTGEHIDLKSIMARLTGHSVDSEQQK